MGVKANGHVAMNGQALKGSRPSGHVRLARQRRSGVTSRGAGVLVRLLGWYTLITILFRCPSTPVGLNSDSPRLCKPYFDAKEYLSPRLEPYYNVYAAPYVDAARPYVTTFDNKVFTPTVDFGKRSYDKYGAARINRARRYGESQWQRSVRPKIDLAAAYAERQYNITLAPHVTKATDHVFPYYDAVRVQSQQIYHAHLLPAYAVSRPYAQRAYTATSSVVVNQGYSYLQSAWRTTAVIINKTLWPKLKLLYGESVEPQIVRISERLGRYRDHKNLDREIQHRDGSLVASTIVSSMLSTGTSMASTVLPAEDVGPHHAPENHSGQHVLTPQEEEERVREVVANDLKTWQEKFAKAADKGADDLEERVRELAENQIRSQVRGVGDRRVVELEETTRSQLDGLKQTISSLIEVSLQDADESRQAEVENRINDAVKGAGLAIKAKAQALRRWKVELLEETLGLAWEATQSTLAILDGIRDLGLQEVGMRWAWMDGVTYKDWSKYHSLRQTFDGWRDEVQAVARDHQNLAQVSQSANEVESKGMLIAEEAAKELARLKDLGKWKLLARDSTDDFSDSARPRIAKFEQVVTDQLKKAEYVAANNIPEDVKSSTSDATKHFEDVASAASGQLLKAASAATESAVDTISTASSRVTEAYEQASGAVVDQARHVGPKIEAASSSMVLKPSDTLSKSSEAVVEPNHDAPATPSSVPSEASFTASAAPRKVWGGAAAAQEVKERKIQLDFLDDDDEKSAYSDTVQSMANEAGHNLRDLTKAVQEALLGTSTTQGSVGAVTSIASEQYSRALSAASSVLYGTQQGMVESASSVASKQYADAVSAASSAIYGAPTPTLGSVAAAASSQYFRAISHAQEIFMQAKASASSKVNGEEPSTKDQILSSFEAAYSNSVHTANEQLQQALSAVSTGVYGAPLKPRQSLSSIAKEKYSSAMAAASSQYRQAAQAVTGSPTPAAESLLSAAKRKYSDVVDQASSQYASAASAAQTAYYGPGQGPLESISSIASAKLSDGLRAASERYSKAKDGVMAQPTPAREQYILDTRRRYYEAVGLAHDQYSVFVRSASSAMYGTPTPAYQSLSSQASVAVYETAAPGLHSALAAAQSQYSNAVAAASSQLVQVAEQVTSAVGKTKHSSAQGVLSSASSRYSAAISAASASLSSVSVAASTAMYGRPAGSIESIASAVSQQANSAASLARNHVVGSETPWTESIASAASQNWDALISKASEQVYGTPTPFAESFLARAGGYAAQATDAAASQALAMQALVSELIVDREPAFSESVMGRFSSAIYTGSPAMASSASSYASEAYGSASSMISAVFTPPPAVEAILEAASNQISLAVDAASEQIYGSSTGVFESATSVMADKAASVQSQVSEVIYGTQPSYAEAAQSQIADAASSAQSAISMAIYGTPTVTGTMEQVTDAAGVVYSSVSKSLSEAVLSASSMAGDQYSIVKAKASSALYGPEQGAVESAQSRLSGAMESARARLAEMVDDMTEGARGAVESARVGMENAVDNASSIVLGSSSSTKPATSKLSAESTVTVRSTTTKISTIKDEL